MSDSHHHQHQNLSNSHHNLLLTTVCVLATTAVVSIGYKLFGVSLFSGGNNKKNTFLGKTGPNEFVPIKLIQKKEISPNTRLFRFALDHPQQILGLPVGQHMSLRATIKNEVVQRSYTPISSNDDLGYVDFVIKVYFAGENPKFPDGGKMSQHLESMKIGESIDVKGPTGRFDYSGKGQYIIKKGLDNFVTKKVKKMTFIAGGTGITPCLAIIRAVLKDPQDQTQVSLLYANHSEQDILMRRELDEDCTKDPRFSVWYTVCLKPSSKWKYSEGHIDEAMVKKHLPSGEDGNSDNVIACLCGPPGLVQASKSLLQQHGFKAEQIVVF